MKKTILLIIIFSMLFSTYPIRSLAATDDDYDEGFSDGKSVGSSVGELAGKKDFSDGKDNDYWYALPSNSDLVETYHLSREPGSYKRGFIKGYEEGFEKAYNEGFRNASLDTSSVVTTETGLSDGRNIGKLVGDAYGRSTFMNGGKSNWENSLPSDYKLITDYHLDRETTSYKEDFLKGYKDAFEANYILGFRSANLQIAKDHISDMDDKVYTNISMVGGEVTSNDGIMELEINEGTLYRDNYLSIDKDMFDFSYLGGGMTPATEIYHVMVLNQNHIIYPKKEIVLTFQYYGSEAGGIYQLINGEWIYLPSELGKDSLSTTITLSSYMGGTYALLIDENYKPFDDTLGHWADEEINQFSRNHYLINNGNGDFNPDKAITRGEFVSLLDKFYKWPYAVASGYLKDYKDYPIIGEYAGPFSKAVYMGYISGYADNTLRPHQSITYQEAEWIMQRVLQDHSFQWDSIAEKIKEKNGTYSNGLVNKKGYLTKAEAVYLLYSLKYNR